MILESLWNPYNTNPSAQRKVNYPTSCTIEPFVAVTNTLDNSLTEEELNRFDPLQNSAEEPGCMETGLAHCRTSQRSRAAWKHYSTHSSRKQKKQQAGARAKSILQSHNFSDNPSPLSSGPPHSTC